MLCVIAAFVAVAALSPNPTTGPCTRIGDAAQLREVPEASGLAVSRRQPGLLWTHNDSGHDTELFAVDSSGAVQGRVRLPVVGGPCLSTHGGISVLWGQGGVASYAPHV